MPKPGDTKPVQLVETLAKIDALPLDQQMPAMLFTLSNLFSDAALAGPDAVKQFTVAIHDIALERYEPFVVAYTAQQDLEAQAEQLKIAADHPLKV